ncbi:hypothetical protein [Botrimarina sp.]|uniref:hypothetical protein n=1 Tax=Botrimarina sp. TaxID=2795802 RepID=UPI0032EAA3A6
MSKAVGGTTPRRLPALVIGGAVVSAAVCCGEEAHWSEPALDTWAYVNGFGGGSRVLAPSFGGMSVDSDATAFQLSDQRAPARLGSLLVAFQTSGRVAAGLDPSRYVVHAARVTARVQSGSTGTLPYSGQAVTPEGLLADALGQGIDSQQPMELFGVGFRDGYEGFALGAAAGGQGFNEATPVYSATDGGYVAYPIVGDAAGGFADVSNNPTGGFSATAPGGQTDPFAATPWAIGAASLGEGDPIANDTTFTFDIDLSQPGVGDYLRRSLAEGAVGFFLSSLHPAGEQGAPGGGAYPQWYTKESVGVFAGGEAPTLTLDVSVLPVAGDYNADGDITGADYAAWASAYGQVAAPPGVGADGNRDGLVDAADYTVWRDAQPGASAAVAAPEPRGAATLLAALAGWVLAGPLGFTSSRRGRP